ncbi:MAG TPA: helix-turn-helix domain-containing protein [Bryobacteraceae bacterium]|nr:helix-turn-helix domain-containing protein [Bryobacteraceae bacterium]HZW96197.1 helix-turn-helix domain-containing protein [Candidatus Eremiobacteraceae bacterium]
MVARTAVVSRVAPRRSQELDDLLQQVADSETFRTAPMMRALLLYLWNHREERVSEYALAVDALGRSADFDPKTDSTVRVHVARLRTKLREFCDSSDASFPIRLSIPLGRHELQWVYKRPKLSFVSVFKRLPLRYIVGLAAVVSGLVFVCTALVIQNRGLRAAIPPSPPPLPRFWRSFLAGGKFTTVVVPSPMYFFWPDHKLYVRDLEISDFPKWPTSPILRDLSKRLGPPELSQSYIGAPELTAGVKLLQYLEKNGQQVELIESRRFGAGSFAAQNTVFLGMPRTAVYLNGMLEKLNFYIARVTPDLVRNRNPKPGEPAEFQETAYSADRRISPAIVVLLPARPEGTRSLLLLGRALTSMTSLLLSREGLKLVEEQWAKSGSPDAWEMVIEAEIYRDTILKVWPVSLRPIPSTFWE